MAIQGNLYNKTTWAFEERPVPSAKLNTWDDRIEAALETLARLLAHTWGGGDGVLRGLTTDDLQIVPTTPPSLTTQAKPGYAFIKKLPYRLTTTTDAPAVTPPATHPRIDLIQADLNTWGITLKQGTEAPLPTPPAPDPDTLPLAHLYLRPGMTTIKATDDTLNGYITDTRPFL